MINSRRLPRADGAFLLFSLFYYGLIFNQLQHFTNLAFKQPTDSLQNMQVHAHNFLAIEKSNPAPV
jgi:hypothetical protein